MENRCDLKKRRKKVDNDDGLNEDKYFFLFGFILYFGSEVSSICGHRKTL